VLEHVGKIIGANPDVGADGAVIVNGDFLSLVDHTTSFNRPLIRCLLPGESCLVVGAVTKRFFGGLAASAEGIVLSRFDFISLRVLKRHTALNQIRAMRSNGDVDSPWDPPNVKIAGMRFTLFFLKKAT
jgi:hypothetical protein